MIGRASTDVNILETEILDGGVISGTKQPDIVAWFFFINVESVDGVSVAVEVALEVVVHQEFIFANGCPVLQITIGCDIALGIYGEIVEVDVAGHLKVLARHVVVGVGDDVGEVGQVLCALDEVGRRSFALTFKA